MYMEAMVSSARSVRILYPREYYDLLEDPEAPLRTVCHSTTWYLVRILYCRESYDSWENIKGLIRTVDAPVSFWCHKLLTMLFQLCVLVDDFVPASCF
jgi:hypothetical protein